MIFFQTGGGNQFLKNISFQFLRHITGIIIMQIQSMEINSISRCELTPKMNNITRRRIVVYVGNLKKRNFGTSRNHFGFGDNANKKAERDIYT